MRLQKQLQYGATQEKAWEDQINEKYHLPAGVAWKIDSKTGTILIPPEQEGEPGEAEPAGIVAEEETQEEAPTQ